jgi:hypothetical protein
MKELNNNPEVAAVCDEKPVCCCDSSESTPFSKDCKHYIADGSSRHGLCELKKSRIDKWGQEVSIRRMASGKACGKSERGRRSAP